MKVAEENDCVLLIAPDSKRHFIRLYAGGSFHSHKGIIDHDSLIGMPLGRQVVSHLGHLFTAVQPSLHDLLMSVKRVSQIIYPKEIGQILLKLDVSHGKRMVEAGTGSGALTLALASLLAPDGMVYSYDAREDMLRVARRNIERSGVQDYVQFIHRDITDGFTQTDVDALFLDVREPWEYLHHVCDALRDGGFFGALVPTTNQVSDLLSEMKKHPFIAVEVMEILLREYKPVPARLRPRDRMVGHTGFLVFARKVGLLQMPQEGPASDAGELEDHDSDKERSNGSQDPTNCA